MRSASLLMFVAVLILAATVVSADTCSPYKQSTCPPQQQPPICCPAPTTGAGPTCPVVTPTCPVTTPPCPVATPPCPSPPVQPPTVVVPAQACPVTIPSTTCPATATCPAAGPVEPACPEACPSVSCIIATQTQPAGIGAGPASVLADQAGPCFDAAFIKTMYQQHTDVAALSTIGISQATDKTLRDLSGKIRYEQTKQSEKLALWNCQMGLGPIPVDYNRTESVVQYLACLSGQEFDVAYAKTMIGYLQQSQCAAQLALDRGCKGDLRNQAKIVVRSTQNEILALQRWLNAQCAR